MIFAGYGECSLVKGWVRLLLSRGFVGRTRSASRWGSEKTQGWPALSCSVLSFDALYTHLGMIESCQQSALLLSNQASLTENDIARVRYKCRLLYRPKAECKAKPLRHVRWRVSLLVTFSCRCLCAPIGFQ